MPRTDITVEIDFAGEEGNIFFVLGKVGAALRDAERGELSDELRARILSGEANTYEEALEIVGEYVELKDVSE